MPGGIHPPLSVALTWPTPNYVDPVTRPKVATILACVLGPLTALLLAGRLWVRIRLQRNPGLDDWLIMAAIIPIVALTVIIPLAADVYHFNKHLWDVRPEFYVIQRKLILTIETIFCVASGLIKVSILLFYKRLGFRAVSNVYCWAIRLTIAFIIAYSIAFTLIPIFGCRPISAFWDQVDPDKAEQGYTYKCFDEGVDLVTAGVISAAQDLQTAILPTFLYWNLQMPIRQKVALFGIFAIGYITVGLGALRTYFSWKIFYETYDVTWEQWHNWNWSLLEIHLGAICANAPALKMIFKNLLKIKPSRGNARFSTTKGSNQQPDSSFGASNYSGATMLSTSAHYRHYDQISEGYTDSDGGVATQQEGHDREASASKRSSAATILPQPEDIELGELHVSPRPLPRARVVSCNDENMKEWPSLDGAALLQIPDGAITPARDTKVPKRPKFKSWS